MAKNSIDYRALSSAFLTQEAKIKEVKRLIEAEELAIDQISFDGKDNTDKVPLLKHHADRKTNLIGLLNFVQAHG